MTLATSEFIRRFLLHVLPKGLHRIRHYGLLANTGRAENLARMRELLSAATHEEAEKAGDDQTVPNVLTQPCPCCGGRMFVVETFDGVCPPRLKPSQGVTLFRIDTS